MSFFSNKTKNISRDFLLNIASSFLSTSILQLLVYPCLARMFSDVYYGVILTIMGVANTLGSAVGNTLNNTRLIMQGEFKDDGLNGDYKVILLVLNIIGVIFFVVYSSVTHYGQWLEIVLLSIYIIVSSIKTYAVVDFRLVLNFRKNFICTLYTAIGNGVGLVLILLFKLNSFWPMVFIFGEFCSLIYLEKNSRFPDEKFTITDNFKIILKKETVLLITNVMANVLIYLDRLLLLPLLGGAIVTTYTVASLFGKCLGIVMTPIAGVLLGYYSQKNFSLSQKNFWKLNVSVLVLGGVFFLICCICAEFLTGLLYPTVILVAHPYILSANFIAILGVVASMTQPAILRFAPTMWQLILQVIYCFLYIVLGIKGTKTNGLQGFIEALVWVNIIKIGFLYILGIIYIKDVRDAT